MQTSLQVLKNKRIFITGHTGFCGSWLAIWLNHIGANLYGFSLPAPTEPSNYKLANIKQLLKKEWIADICDRETLLAALKESQPEIVFHLAAQAIVSEGYKKPLETVRSNVLGTAAVLDCLRELNHPCAVVVVTSDKCYHNPEALIGLKENDRMGGKDPYSASKGAAELIVDAYRNSYFNPKNLTDHGVQLASVRAGNIIGGGDWAENRIIPDIVKALSDNKPVMLRHPKANRPWQHICDPLYGYMLIAAKMVEVGGDKWSSGWNLGPAVTDLLSVSDLTEHFISVWGSGSWISTEDHKKMPEATNLQLSTEKAKNELGWICQMTPAQAVERTASWFLKFQSNAKAIDLCLDDISNYEKFS